MPKPSEADIRALARREATPAAAAAHLPIVRGPVFAVLALAVLGVLSLPWLAWHLLTRARMRPT